MKIAVIGYSGAGKSTLAKKLGKLFRCPVLHLDRIQFEPGWKERDRETAKRMAEDFLDENENRGWIIDGNYTGFSQERRLREADLIIFMNYPRWICLWQALVRSRIYRGRTREDMGDGCIEKWTGNSFGGFFTRGAAERRSASTAVSRNAIRKRLWW